jgi:hypothetical protein
MKILAIITALVLLIQSAWSGDLTAGITFQDGQRITAAQLAQLVNQAVINPSFYTAKISQTNLAPTDVLLVYSAASGTFHQLSGNAAVFQNPALIVNQPDYTASQITTNSWFLGYDGTNYNLFKANLTNLTTALSPFIVPSLLNMSNTLTAYSPAQPNPYYLTNAVQLMVWDTNGALHSISLSNLIAAATLQLATNQIGTINQQVFYPWTYYGTNAAGFTNSWTGPTNFPITALFVSGTNAPTLVDTDTVPVMSSQQMTNTTATLGSIFQYITNKNGLPPYTTARVQFGGTPALMIISNTLSTSLPGILMMTNPATGWTTNFFPTNGITAISFITNSGTPLFSGIATNQVYYVIGSVTNSVNGEWLRVFTNYSLATLFLQNGSLTNCVAVNSSTVNATTMLYLTNYTSFNCDAVAVCQSASLAVRTAVYDIWFRTPAANAFYYVTANTMQVTNNGPAGFFSICWDMLPDTNHVRITTVDTGGSPTPTVFPLNHVLIQPQ